MLKKIIAFTISIISIASMTGCTAVNDFVAEVTGETSEFPVAVGHEVIISQPSKIIVLDDNIADILVNCGYTDKIIGKTEDCTQNELKDIKEYGSDKNPNTDAVNKLNADIIFASPDVSYSDYKKMKDDDTIVLRFTPATSTSSLKNLYSNVCKVMSGNISGDNVGKNKSEELLNNMKDISNKNVVIKGCYLFDINGESAVTADMFANIILEDAGIQNIATENDKNGILPNERILAADKQDGFAFYILCDKELKNKILSNKEFESTNVVNKNRIIEVPSSYLTRQGNTAVEGIKYITNQLSKNKNVKGESLTVDYGIDLYEGISYTLEDQDNYVMAIQQRLDDLGYLPIDPTGFFGDSTASAVKEFQINNELNRRDGVADYETLEKLFSTAAYSRSTPIKEDTNLKVQAQSQTATEPATFSVTTVDE